MSGRKAPRAAAADATSPQSTRERKNAARVAAPATLVAVELHVEGFRKARAARRSAIVEDYVELIADLVDESGGARQVDIASRLGVAQPTVAKMLKRLAEGGLVAQNPGRGTCLTLAGAAIALRSRERHRVVEEFLRALGISSDIARRDAEGIEHHVSEETLDAFARFLGRRSE